MRPFEIHRNEIVEAEHPAITGAIVDLDCIVRFNEFSFIKPDRGGWSVIFVDGDGYWLTESGFNRILAAWKAN